MTRSRMILALAGLPALFSTATFSADWPGFRGPDGCAVSPEKGLPIQWAKSDGVRWKASLPGMGLSSPVVAGGRVYVTACSGYRQRRLHVIALDEATGRKRWERQFSATGNTACNPASNMAAPTPAADGKAVYALFATGDLAAVDRDGNLLWYRSLVGDYPQITNQVGMASSPALAGNVLLLPMENAGDSFAAGLDKRTGKNRWKVKRMRCVNWVSPIVFPWEGRTAALFQTQSEAAAHDSETGKLLWSYAGEGLDPIKSPCAGDGRVFLAAGKLLALRPGKERGASPEEVWRTGNLAQGYASPVYHRGRVYYLSPVAVVCLNALDGKEVWRRRIPGPFDASPVIGDGKLYAVNNKGQTSVIELGDKPRMIGRNDLEDAVQATPAIANGCLYFRSEKAVYCVGAKKAASH